jgi:hypothetical protein
MSTTNLISKSLGDILTESGNGTPDHTSPSGSLYVDQTTGVLYQNVGGGTVWQKLNTVAYSEGYYQDNTTQTTITTANTWVGVGNNFNLDTTIGFSANANTLVLISGYDGVYEVKGDVTINNVTGINTYDIGLSVNNTVPAAGTFNSATVDATYTRQQISFDTIVNLSGGDNLRLAVRNLTLTNNVIIRHASLFLKKIG